MNFYIVRFRTFGASGRNPFERTVIAAIQAPAPNRISINHEQILWDDDGNCAVHGEAAIRALAMIDDGSDIGEANMSWRNYLPSPKRYK